MDATPSQIRLLTRHFIGRFLENDLLSPHEGLQAGFAGALALCATPALMLPVVLLLKYSYPFQSAIERDVASWSDKCLFVSGAMIAMAGLAALQWNSLRPDRRDYLILLPLPIARRTILWAKLAALAWLFAAFTAAVMGFAPILFPFAMFVNAPASMAEIARWMAAHAVAVLAASSFAFFGMLALHGVLLLLLRPRTFRAASVFVQSTTIFALALAFLLLPLIAGSTAPMKRAGGLGMFFMPTLWFVGLYQTLGGRGDAGWAALARVAWLSLAAVVPIATATHLLGFRRHVVSTLESPPALTKRPPGWRRFWTRAAAALAGRRPARHSMFAFALRTLTRSPRHRLALAGYLGAGCAIAAVSLASSMWYRHAWHRPGVASVLSVQNVLTFALVTAVRFAASVPSDLNASWVFRLLAPRDARAWRAGLKRALAGCGVVPLVLILLPVNGALIGWPRAWAHALVGLMFGAALVQAFFFGFSKVPFACSLTPGAGGPKVRWAFYWFGFTTYAFVLARVEALALDEPGGLATLLIVAAVALATLAAIEWRSDRAAAGPVFEEQDDWAMQRLDLYG